MFDLLALENAILVAEHGSFRLAAKILSVKPPVVSRRVRSLEDHIGVGLFQRQRKGAVPTAAGDRFLARGRDLLADLEGLVRTAQLNGTAVEGMLRVGVVSSIAGGLLRRLLAAFMFDHPGWTFRLSRDLREITLLQ